MARTNRRNTYGRTRSSSYGSRRGRRTSYGGRGRRYGSGRSGGTGSSQALRFAIPLGIVAVLAVVAYACMPTKDTRPLLFVGLDRTRSFEQVAGDDLTDQLDTLLRECARTRCHVAADGLTDHSAGDSRIPFDATLEPPSGTEGVDPQTIARELAAGATQSIATALPFDDSVRCSDVLGGFAVALNAMSSFDGGGPHSIVFFTDGWSNCAPWDLAAATRTADGPQQLLDRLEADGAVPDLHGVTVRIAGGGRSEVPDTERTNRIQQFWQAYLDAAGATLPSDWWRPSLSDQLRLDGGAS